MLHYGGGGNRLYLLVDSRHMKSRKHMMRWFPQQTTDLNTHDVPVRRTPRGNPSPLAALDLAEDTVLMLELLALDLPPAQSIESCIAASCHRLGLPYLD